MGIAVLNAMLSPRRANRREPTHGFTLLEIMVVSALISLLTTGVAVGAISAGRDQAFDTDDDVKSDDP
jgi:prepilin-type N-terminal cleavage/methylation domain-containing protein